jgi:hypothetical protein
MSLYTVYFKRNIKAAVTAHIEKRYEPSEWYQCKQFQSVYAAAEFCQDLQEDFELFVGETSLNHRESDLNMAIEQELSKIWSNS